MADRMDTCASCRFFRRGVEFYDGGECRRRSPGAKVASQPEIFPPVHQPLWPPVLAGDWCGDYECRRG